jgi:hypothetical protein
MINDYLVRLGTANEDNVANELMRCEINSFGNQNQASHLTSNSIESLPFVDVDPG